MQNKEKKNPKWVKEINEMLNKKESLGEERHSKDKTNERGSNRA